MLVPEEYILDERERATFSNILEPPPDVPEDSRPQVLSWPESEGIHIRYHETNPHVISDGVDHIAVIKESDERYRLDYRGYLEGRIYVSLQGIEVFGEQRLGGDEPVPSWIVDIETVDGVNIPWWFPDEADIYPQATCQECSQEKHAREMWCWEPEEGPDDLRIICKDCSEA